MVVRNNFFGIKWTGKGEKQLVTTTEILWSANVQFPVVLSMTKRADGKYVYKVKDYFRKYDTLEQSFQDHALFFQENKRYAKAWEVRGDYNRFFEEIAEAGYATADNYADY
ncbi:glucosaminidase domain-containing protein [Myroides sp. TSA_177.3]|uniref:glucosaminidase domain-containing protein n=1 Tax=Myroides sp. TSA_177.3 TaxID=3415650 RepID=UPI004045A7DB